MTERVLVIAAHPDDEILGMGGTIAIHATLRGDDVRILCVTDGSSTQYPGDTEKRERKEREAISAAAVLGVTDYVHLDLPDMRLDTIPHHELNAVIEAQITDFRPTVVYAVHPDVNRDHRAVFDSVAVAARAVPGRVTRRFLTFAPISSVEWTPRAIGTFEPTWFVDIGATLEAKLASFACYETERREAPHPRSEHGIRAHAAFWGAAAGCAAAEPFNLVRLVESAATRG